MMAKDVFMPKLGLTMTEGTVSAWHKKPGEPVRAGEPLFDVETDKLTNTIEAFDSGVLIQISVPAGETVPCLTKLALIGEPGEAPPETAPPAAPAPGAKAEETEHGSVLVIGGGPGGYVAAIRAAQLGAKVTLVEKAELGGTCLNRGCMPTKAMLHCSEVYQAAVGSADIGIIGADVRVDWEKIQRFRASVVARLTGGVAALVKMNRIRLVKGEARFTGEKALQVDGKELRAEKIIIAAGSRPILPDIPGMRQSQACIDSTACLSLDHIPESLLVIGGGVIGLELGSVYLRYGTKVTVVEARDRLLPLMDGELTALAQAKLQGQSMEILTGSRVLSVSDCGAGATVRVACPEGEREIAAEKILVSIGRAPDTAGLDAEKGGLRLKDGFIEANDRMETSVPGVYAVGDCTGKLMLAHAAMAMGECAAENALGGDRRFDPELSPSCAYIGPEFASVGYTEERARELGLEYRVGRFPTSGNGRSLVAGHTDGMIKILAGARFGEILGVHILAPGATELIQEAALAIRLEATLDELADTIHCHPTVAEALRECALAADGKAIHIPNRK